MDIGAVLIHLKPNAMANVEAWQTELNLRKEEAIETLMAEGVHIESWFFLELDKKQYLLAYMRAKDIKQAQVVGRKSNFPIDEVHKVFKQNWEKVIQIQLLVDLENTKFQS